MTFGLRSRSLPVAPIAAPARRRLPLADDVRAVDRGWRPGLRRMRDHVALRPRLPHCGSRAGHARPDELSTTEALDLVRHRSSLVTRT